MSHATDFILTVFAGSLMMTAVLNTFRNGNDTQIRASCAHALLLHTHTNAFKVTKRVQIWIRVKRSGISVPGTNNTRGAGVKRRWELSENETRVEYYTFDCARSARVSVGAQRLAQARSAVRRSGRASDFTGLILRRQAAPRSLRPICIATNDRGHASERRERAGGLASAKHRTAELHALEQTTIRLDDLLIVRQNIILHQKRIRLTFCTSHVVFSIIGLFATKKFKLNE